MKTLIAAAILALSMASPSSAMTLEDVIDAQVLTGWQTADGDQQAGLRLSLAPGWKTYWRAPGDAGIPPLFDWTGSRNVAGVVISWPVPDVLDQAGMRSIGYADGVVLPLRVIPRDPGQPIELRGTVDLGVCEDICIPARLTIAANLTRPGARDTAIVAALLDRPLTATEAGLARHSCRIGQTAMGLSVRATLDLPPTGGPEEVVIEAGDPAIWVSEPSVSRQGDRLVAQAEMIHSSGDAFALDRRRIVLTVLGSRDAVEIRGCPAE